MSFTGNTMVRRILPIPEFRIRTVSWVYTWAMRVCFRSLYRMYCTCRSQGRRGLLLSWNWTVWVTSMCELLAYTPHLRPIPLGVYICRRYHTGSHPRYSSLLGACERSLVHRLHCLPLQVHTLCGTSIEVKVDMHNTLSSHQSVQLLGVVVQVLISTSVYAGHWIL